MTKNDNYQSNQADEISNIKFDYALGILSQGTGFSTMFSCHST